DRRQRQMCIRDRVWVKVPVIDGTNGAIVKMYYGNSTVASESDGDGVFDFFEDFSSDLSKWNVISGVSIENGKGKLNNIGHGFTSIDNFSLNGDYVLSMNWEGIASFDSNYDTIGLYIDIDDASKYAYVKREYSAGQAIAWNCPNINTGYQGITTNVGTSGDMEFRILDKVLDNARINSYHFSGIGSVPTEDHFQIQPYTRDGYVGYVDNIILRKTCSVEPVYLVT
ncbi:DUF2341 domain-containing protein, partial [Methanosarcina sp. 2.H.T.1A.3]|uniref:DUF2341 domain-containing protein n=1 Tax=Methanosarcina sp. 2.H.T.1A.3 TaxID=1483597 RepID=UPI00064FF3FD